MVTTTSLTLPTLSVCERRTQLFAALFTLGNILMPQLCHLIPNGGFMLLPIYFFTLIGAYLYGWQLGLLVAVASPVVNHLLFGMPAADVLPSILVKSTLLAVSAAWVARRTQQVSIALLAVVVLGYQLVGSLVESAFVGSLAVGFQDFRIGLPGMLLQVVGGYVLIRWLGRQSA